MWDEEADFTSRLGKGSTPRSLLAVVGEGVVDRVRVFGRVGLEAPLAQLEMKRKLCAGRRRQQRMACDVCMLCADTGGIDVLRHGRRCASRRTQLRKSRERRCHLRNTVISRFSFVPAPAGRTMVVRRQGGPIALADQENPPILLLSFVVVQKCIRGCHGERWAAVVAGARNADIN